jgi:phosphonate transport system substrate-binding protein
VGAKQPHQSADGAPVQLGVGVALTTDPTTTRDLLDLFCFALGQATGLEIVAAGVWHYQHLMDDVAKGLMHLVWLPPILALRAAAEGRVVPIALPVRDGVSTYRTALFARQDSPIRGVGDLHQLRAAWVDAQSATGYLIIRAHLETLGVKLQDAFRSDSFLGSHHAVVEAVQNGEADVGATYLYLDDEGGDARAPRSSWGDLPMKVVVHSGPIPSDVLAADKRVPADVIARVQEALVGGAHPAVEHAARELLAADAFVRPTAELLQPLQELLGGLKGATGAHSLFPPPPPSSRAKRR